jgi:hypothetical protein
MESNQTGDVSEHLNPAKKDDEVGEPGDENAASQSLQRSTWNAESEVIGVHAVGSEYNRGESKQHAAQEIAPALPSGTSSQGITRVSENQGESLHTPSTQPDIVQPKSQNTQHVAQFKGPQNVQPSTIDIPQLQSKGKEVNTSEDVQTSGNAGLSTSNITHANIQQNAEYLSHPDIEVDSNVSILLEHRIPVQCLTSK